MREPAASLNPLGISRAIRNRLVNFNDRMRIVRSHEEADSDEDLDPKLMEWLEAQEDEFEMIRSLEAQERKKEQVREPSHRLPGSPALLSTLYKPKSFHKTMSDSPLSPSDDDLSPQPDQEVIVPQVRPVADYHATNERAASSMQVLSPCRHPPNPPN